MPKRKQYKPLLRIDEYEDHQLEFSRIASMCYDTILLGKSSVFEGKMYHPSLPNYGTFYVHRDDYEKPEIYEKLRELYRQNKRIILTTEEGIDPRRLRREFVELENEPLRHWLINASYRNYKIVRPGHDEFLWKCVKYAKGWK